MPSVLFWSGQPGGTGEYRCFGPGRALARLGWDVTFEEEGFEMTLDGHVRGDPDVLVLCRTMGDYLPDAVRRIRARGRTRVVFDVDDWFAGVPDYNPASRLPGAYVNTMHQAMAEADLITCSTPELAEGYAHLGPTVVLPNYLDPDIWSDNERYHQPRSAIHIGWLGAFHWRNGDLESLRDWLPDFLATHPDVRFVALGCRELLEWLGVDGLTTPQLEANQGPLSRNLHPYTHLPAMLAHLDVGLAPLTSNRFNRAKSWIKPLEYNAMAVPAVVSPSREYRAYIRPGINGLFARRDWASKVEAVLADLDAYRDGARKVAAEYFIDDHIHKWVAVYTGRTIGEP